MKDLAEFREIWCVDTEFCAPDGERPDPVVCLVARELRSNRLLRFWLDELKQMREAPYSCGDDVLFLAYSSPAEILCHLALGWKLPKFVCDLFVEFKARTNGFFKRAPKMLDALAFYKLDTMDADEKDRMRALVMTGGPWTDAEREAILVYCQSDVDACARLFMAMAARGDIHLGRALLRGRYMVTVGVMEWNGVPIDREMYIRLVESWPHIQDALIGRVDRVFHVYDGQSFRIEKFERYLQSQGIPWPRTGHGRPCLDDDTFEEMAKSYPQVLPLRELRAALSRMRKSSLTIGKDSRNRLSLMPFGTVTSRNTPSASRFIFSASSWMRGLIKPEPGSAVAYIDFDQQEFGIAAALSGDLNMTQAYVSTDPYLAFGKLAGAIPADGTKESHPLIRESFKQCVLGMNYGMGANALAARLSTSPAHARELQGAYRKTFSTYETWKQAQISHALLTGRQETVLGWPRYLAAPVNTLSVGNFPVQGAGAEVTRLSCCLAVERGVRVLCSVHDALMVEGAADEIEDVIVTTKQAMADASLTVLRTLTLRSGVKTIKFPSRYSDDKGSRMWSEVTGLMAERGY